MTFAAPIMRSQQGRVARGLACPVMASFLSVASTKRWTLCGGLFTIALPW